MGIKERKNKSKARERMRKIRRLKQNSMMKRMVQMQINQN